MSVEAFLAKADTLKAKGAKALSCVARASVSADLRALCAKPSSLPARGRAFWCEIPFLHAANLLHPVG